MSAPDQPTSRLDRVLAARPDDELVDLLRARPDLASPPPNGTGVLAQRAMSAGSMNLIGENLDLLHAAVLETLVDADHPLRTADVRRALKGRAARADVDARIADLVAWAVVWEADDGLHVAGHTPAALPWRARHLTTEAATRTPEQWRELLDGLADGPREVLTALATGPSVGMTRDAGPDADPTRPVPILLAAGLISPVDHQLVEIEPTVAQLVRGEPLLRVDDLNPPPLSASDRPGLPGGAKALSATAAGAALELLRETGDVLTGLGRAPAPELSAGGIGIRELRRVAKDAGLDARRVGLIVELCAREQLLDVGVPDPEPAGYDGGNVWAPTIAADSWSHQSPARKWASLASAWLGLPNRAWLIGERDSEGTVIGALTRASPDPAARRERLLILTALDAAGHGVAPDVDALVSHLLWLRPRLRRRLTRHTVAQTLREATEVGLVAHGALTDVGRLLLSDVPREELTAAMDAALPEPVDHFLAQADLTLMVPGPMTPELAAEVALVAELESAGAASVYRVTENSVRRALDAGRTGAELNALFTSHSSTPVPQALTYLIDDVARRHGTLRVGVASSFVRCDDPATMTAVLRTKEADALALRPLAPTVLISPAPLRDVLEALRGAGFAPAAEDSSGALVDLRSTGSRINSRRRGGAGTHNGARVPDDQLEGVVARMRTADAAGKPLRGGTAVRATGGASGGESVSALIGLAMRTGRQLRVDYVDSHGKATRHVVKARLLRAGRLIASELPSGNEVELSVHRITTVELLD
ncbi:helicase-associated domain-containing protein [Gordonia sp. X0973]|uniref:helicase-associated domain-containing protein n=1 Tax=Gordonia sp. X0973 TaxID=2742602 RepID=UPI000F52024E|nr:helicase-associated domain-containing protein [Gordonia sp. X0973]QKT06362.1 helicase-associated domain-containing protein [Gordonia sp. X0973]